MDVVRLRLKVWEMREIGGVGFLGNQDKLNFQAFPVVMSSPTLTPPLDRALFLHSPFMMASRRRIKRKGASSILAPFTSKPLPTRLEITSSL